ncbi:hypothetical protein, partial [Burkholderia humptydooensis]|uniref:hypothetical protein n=1 Tax=Burkholderia humptydooensis TaxID=430531 RepID=UPI001E5EC276
MKEPHWVRLVRPARAAGLVASRPAGARSLQPRRPAMIGAGRPWAAGSANPARHVARAAARADMHADIPATACANISVDIPASAPADIRFDARRAAAPKATGAIANAVPLPRPRGGADESVRAHAHAPPPRPARSPGTRPVTRARACGPASPLPSRARLPSLPRSFLERPDRSDVFPRRRIADFCQGTPMNRISHSLCAALLAATALLPAASRAQPPA